MGIRYPAILSTTTISAIIKEQLGFDLVWIKRSMLRLGGRSSSPKCRDAVCSQLDELLHLLLSDAGTVEWWAGWIRTNTGSDSDKLDASLHSVTEDHRPPPTPITPGTERLTLQEAEGEGWEREVLSWV
eukprot:superscaffoldBa00006753_g21856